MGEENLNIELEGEQKEAPAEVEYSETELAAIERGWNPDGVEGKRNLSAEEFLDRQNLYDDIKRLKRQNKTLQSSFDALKGHHEKVKETERKRVLEELRLKKKLAYEAEDVDAMIAIDDEIADIKTEEKLEKAKPAPTADDSVYQDWVKDNAWYTSDTDLKAEADILGHGYMAANANASLEDALEYVAKQIKKNNPDKFSRNASSGKQAVSVTPASRSATKPKGTKYSEADLSDDERRIMNTIVRSGALTKEQYLKEYFESNKA